MLNLKRKAIKKIIVTTFVLFILLTMYLIPTKEEKKEQEYKYVKSQDISVYLLNKNEQLTKVDFKIKDEPLIDTVKTIIKKLTISNDATIPLNFMQILPKDIKLLDVIINDGIVSLNFSENFLDIPKERIETVVESITYSLLNLEEVNGVSIYVFDENISKLFPKDIPNIITKEYGINKRIELRNFIDVSKVVIYYLEKENDETYYVPITKYINDSRDKIKIIIDELSSNYIYESNLITLLDKNLKLLNYEIESDKMILNFNNSIYLENEKVLEEVIYSISYSVFDNYDVEEVIFKVDNEEIAKKYLKMVE